MSLCENCIHFEENDDGYFCHKGNISYIIICDDFEHWNSISGDSV